MDQLNGTLSLDNTIADGLKSLAPHKSVFDLNAPRKVSQNLSIPKTVIATMANWMHTKKDLGVDNDKLVCMECLFIN